MKTQNKFPKTLREAILHFSDAETCVQFVANMRWSDGVRCLHCGSNQVNYIKTRHIWQCKVCKQQFSVKVKTIFEDSPIPLQKWLPAIWMVVNDKNGISSYEMARALGVTQKTAWFLDHRIRLAMQDGTIEKLSGKVEADETAIGGLSKNMHKSRRARVIHSTGNADKAIAMGILQRGGKVRAMVIPNVSRKVLHGEINQNVEQGSEVFTDAWHCYQGLDPEYVHQVIDHAVAYVNGQVHTNGIENFWSLLKRGIKGTYTHVDPDHLFRYLDEEVFRFNNRAVNDASRFSETVKSIVDKRLTYKQLIGKAS